MKRGIRGFFVRAKPGKTERHAATDGLAFSPIALGADPQDFISGSWLPRRDVGPVEVDGPSGIFSGDANGGKPASTGDDFRDAGDSEFLVECADIRHDAS